MRVHVEGGSQEKRSMSDDLNPCLEEPEVKDLYEACRLFRSVVRKWQKKERGAFYNSKSTVIRVHHAVRLNAYSNVLLQFERHVQPFMIREICMRRDKDELSESTGQRKSKRSDTAACRAKDHLVGRLHGGRRIQGRGTDQGKKAKG